MGLGLTIGIIFVLFGVILIVRYDDLCQFAGIMFTFIGGMVIGWMISEYTNEEALDVYRGNTKLVTIETVRDTVVIKRDTVVVWKDKVKE